MPNYYGFTVVNDNGLIQASDKAYDLTWQYAETLNGEQEFSGDFIAVEPLDGEAFIPVPLPLKFNGGNPNAENNPNTIQKYRGKGKVHYFGYAKQATNENYGLQVFNEFGDLTFSSNMLSIDILKSISLSNIEDELSKNQNQYIAKIFVGDRKIAVFLTGIPFILKRSGDDYHAYSVQFKRVGQYLYVLHAKVYHRFMVSWVGFRYSYRHSLQFLIIDLKGV